MRLSRIIPAIAALAIYAASLGAQGFTVPQVTSYPYPSELVAAPSGTRIAWVLTERGVRNIYVAEGPSFEARRLTAYTADDGQELTYLRVSADGRWLVYVRGGDHGANWPAEGGLAPDPASSAVQPKVQIWAVPFAGGTPKMIAEGDEPTISPRSDRVAYTAGHQIMIVPIDGSAPGKQLFFARGSSGSPAWSPSGDRLAFVSDRGDHSFIGIYEGEGQPLRYLAPTTSRDFMPRWSSDGSRLAFVRIAGEGGAPETLLEQHPTPWSIWSADARTGAGRLVWKSPATLRGSYPSTEGEANLHWMANGRLTFLANLDGWPHLYSIAESGGEPLLLTPGRFMCEYIAPSPDGTFLVYAANAGPLREDLDRRHVFRVSVDRADARPLTPGTGLEWTPVVTGDGATVAFIGATAQRPPLAAVVSAGGGETRSLAADRVPADFPAAQLITPKMVSFTASDGVVAHGQLFDAGGTGKRPAVIFVHGGPPRQMLVGWHYMFYYSNAYAMNQYLASQGYVVLSVNYRLGIGYGRDFHEPPKAGPFGASEYRDVVAGARFLRALPQVDASRMGIWGGSYGGYLTALALARNSDLFATGVDIHGVHDWTSDAAELFGGGGAWRYEKGDVAAAAKVAWQSSPVSSMATWKSPVLLIHGDDDRNVRVHQTVDLVRRLDARGVKHEEMILPDEIHDFLRHATWLTVNQAVADWFDRTIGAKRGTGLVEH